MKVALRVAFAFLLVFGFAAVRARAEMRTWSDKSGKFKVEAEFVEVAAGKVKIKTADGKTASIALDNLSPADRKFVAGLTAPVVATGPIESLVRVAITLTGGGADGQQQELTLVGLALKTDEMGPIVVTSRAGLPKKIDAATLDMALGQAKIINLRTEDELAAVTGLGYPASTEGDKDPLAMIVVLKTSTEAKLAGLALAKKPPASGDSLLAAFLGKPKVRAANEEKPPIPWTRWKISAGATPEAFKVMPDDGQFPIAGPVPLVNERHEVVGLMSVGAQALPDKTKVSTVVGAASLKAAMVKAGITFVAPPTPQVSLANFNPLGTLLFVDSTMSMVHSVVIAPVRQYMPAAPPMYGAGPMPAGGPFGAPLGGMPMGGMPPGGVAMPAPTTDATPQNHTDGPAAPLRYGDPPLERPGAAPPAARDPRNS